MVRSPRSFASNEVYTRREIEMVARLADGKVEEQDEHLIVTIPDEREYWFLPAEDLDEEEAVWKVSHTWTSFMLARKEDVDLLAEASGADDETGGES